jgi:hypothetical protein
MATSTVLRWILGLAGTGVAAVVFTSGMKTHLHRSCVEQDTPYLPICPEPDRRPEALRQQLRDRIAGNPGDAHAWAKLLVVEPEQARAGMLHAAAYVAPTNYNVARLRAIQALQAGRGKEGVDLLVELLRYRYSPDSARVLARLASTSEGLLLLRPHVAGGTEWVPQVISASSSLKMPPGAVLPLVAEALQQRALPDSARQGYMRALKASGDWLDAYGLWLSQHKQPVPLLYNGGFEQPFESDGFDWEYTPAPRSRTGVVLGLEAVARRGLVLNLEFTGRSFNAPIVRQYVFAAPGSYRLRGEYMATKLRSEAGLAWSVVCTAGRKTLAGRSRPLPDTGGLWKPVEVDFTLPPDCGVVASVQLDPAVQYESQAGMKGHVAFDNFTLTPSAVSP